MRLAWPRRTRFTISATIIAGVIALAPSIAEAQIAWRNDLTTAHAEAKADNKPLLLHFYSDNCVWCDRLEAGAFRSSEVNAAVAGGFVPIKIHAGKSPELAKMFNVTKFPTDVVVTPAGQTLAHGVSPQDPNRYVAMLAKAGSQMADSVPTSPAGQPDQRLASAPAPAPPASNPAAANTPSQQRAPQMPVNAASSYAMQQVPGNAMTAQAAMAPPVATKSASMTTAGRPMSNPYGQTGAQNGMPLPGGASARLAGARTDGMSLGMPGQMMDEPTMDGGPAAGPISNDTTDASSTVSTPKLAMEGFCAVTVIDQDKWVEGNPKFGVVHLGKLYLFGSAEKMETFLADPTPYTPVLNEIDVVRFFEERQIVPGKRRFGMRDPIHQRMFFFADEAAMNHFFNEYERYTDAAIEVMAQAVKDANPAVR